MRVTRIIEGVLECGLSDICEEDAKNINLDLLGAFEFSTQDESFLSLFECLMIKTQRFLEKECYECGQPHTPATKLHDSISLALHSIKKTRASRQEKMENIISDNN